MFSFPSIPSWDAMHPFVVHFPIGTLLVAPVFLFIGLARGDHGYQYHKAGFVLMIIGTIGLFLAALTGEAAAETARMNSPAELILAEHERMGETVRFIFLGLVAAAGTLLAIPKFRGKPFKDGHRMIIGSVFLLLYLVGCLALLNTAHAGGRLVHEFGVQAPISTGE